MFVIADPMRDIQCAAPKAYCRICGEELYEYDDGGFCPVCLKEQEDGRTY